MQVTTVFYVVFLHLLFVDFYVWQWKHESGKWSPYSPKISEELEEAHSKGSPTDFEFDCEGVTYKIDFSAMTQINTKTDFSRAISREKSGKSFRKIKQIDITLQFDTHFERFSTRF